MTAPAPAYNFHNRFAANDVKTSAKDIEESNDVVDKGFDINFKDFTDFSPILKGSTSSGSVHDEKRSESSHIASSAESYTNPLLSATSNQHVAALEAAVEEKSDNGGIVTSQALERQYSSSASMYTKSAALPAAPSLSAASGVTPTIPLSSTSNFQQAIKGYGSSTMSPQQSTTQSSEQAPNFSKITLERAVENLDLNGRGGRTPEPGMYANIPRHHNDNTATRSRPSSFFGLEKLLPGAETEGAAKDDRSVFPEANGDDGHAMNGLDGANSIADSRSRRSSFFGMEQPMGHVPNPDRPSEVSTQASRIAASHRNAELIASTDYAPNPTNGPISSGDSGPASGSNSTTRPASIAPTLSGPILDHSHLKPGLQAALLSHNKTLELYRQNAKKTNDPNLIYEFAVFMVDASKSMGSDDSSGGSGGGSGTDYNQGKEEHARDELAREAIGLLKKIAERGHMDAQYFLADCYANGIGSPKGKQDFDRAYPLFVLAAKHGHPDAAYRAGTCYEKGWGCRKDVAKALQFYRKAASQTHPGAMYRLATAELNGELGLKKSAREGVKWLKRSAESATPEFPHALHELALLHERGVDNVLFLDEEYACELLAQAAEMGYAPSAYKLGVNYEYGRMGCPQDGGLSIHMYNIAAQQNHKEACFALTAWYLVGAPGILPQSDTEAYLWAKKAAEQGLAKAEYAVGYFTEMGIGTVRDLAESRAWYRAAAEHGDKRANQRLTALGGQPVPMANEQASTGVKHDSALPVPAQQAPPQGRSAQQVARPGPPGAPIRPVAMSAKEQGQRVAAEQAHRMIAQAEQARQSQQFLAMRQSGGAPPPPPPFLSSGESNGMPSNFGAHSMATRDPQAAQRDHALQMAIQQQHQQRSRGSPAQSSASAYRGPSGSDSAYSHQRPASIFSSNQHGPMSPGSIHSSQHGPSSVYSNNHPGSLPPPPPSTLLQMRPPPGRQASAPANYPPINMNYPSYQGHMSAADSYNVPAGAPVRTDSPSGVTPVSAVSEKKKSLWAQIKEI